MTVNACVNYVIITVFSHFHNIFYGLFKYIYIRLAIFFNFQEKKSNSVETEIREEVLLIKYVEATTLGKFPSRNVVDK